jgi:hypothetical protein
MNQHLSRLFRESASGQGRPRRRVGADSARGYATGDCFLNTGAGGGGGGSSYIINTAQNTASGLDYTASPGVVITPMVPSF